MAFYIKKAQNRGRRAKLYFLGFWSTQSLQTPFPSLTTSMCIHRGRFISSIWIALTKSANSRETVKLLTTIPALSRYPVFAETANTNRVFKYTFLANTSGYKQIKFNFLRNWQHSVFSLTWNRRLAHMTVILLQLEITRKGAEKKASFLQQWKV